MKSSSEKLIGRLGELSLLRGLAKKEAAQLICVHGRRRIGKSYLLENAFDKERILLFEGLENEHTDVQVQQFLKDLARQTENKLLAKAKVSEWTDVLDELSRVLRQGPQKKIVVIDEFQWLATQKGMLVSLFKKYWDQDWSKCNVTMILCGSISSYMVKKVIRSKALYGRINLELNVGPLSFSECTNFLPKRSKEELFRYYLTIGGVPKYWTLLAANKSYEQNIENLFLRKEGYFFSDYGKIFYSQFKEHQNYERIVQMLLERPLNLDEIAKKLKKKSSGSLKSYLDNLCLSGFVIPYVPFNKNEISKLKKYKVSDEYLRYYFKFIQPNKSLIDRNSMGKPLFQRLVQSKWEVWAGFAFENYCLKNAMILANRMGFDDYVESFGPYFERSRKTQKESGGFQVDLVYKRSDKVITVCEISYHQSPIKAQIISKMEEKIKLLTIPRGYTVERALITVGGADEALVESKYFDHILELKDYWRE